jgi:hypothetical protein
LESAAVFLVGVAVVWLVFWVVRNDGMPTIGAQRGLYRMRVPEARPETDPESAPPSTPGQGSPPAGR